MNPNFATYIRNLVQIVCAPSRGWEDLADDEDAAYGTHHESNAPHEPSAAPHETVTRERWDESRAAHMFRTFFIPWIGVCAASGMTRLAYGEDIVGVVQRILAVFVSLFLAAQVGHWTLATYGSRLQPVGADSCKGRWSIMVYYALSFVALVAAVENVVKVRIALVEFMPLYAVFMLWKGWRYAGIDDRNVGLFVALSSAAVLGTVYLVDFLLGTVI